MQFVVGGGHHEEFAGIPALGGDSVLVFVLLQESLCFPRGTGTGLGFQDVLQNQSGGAHQFLVESPYATSAGKEFGAPGKKVVFFVPIVERNAEGILAVEGCELGASIFLSDPRLQPISDERSDFDGESTKAGGCKHAIQRAVDLRNLRNTVILPEQNELRVVQGVLENRERRPREAAFLQR